MSETLNELLLAIQYEARADRESRKMSAVAEAIQSGRIPTEDEIQNAARAAVRVRVLLRMAQGCHTRADKAER